MIWLAATYEGHIVYCCSGIFIIFLNVVALIGGLSMSSVAYQAGDEKLGGQEKILQFLYEDYPPYTYIQDGKVVGIVADLATNIINQAGYDVEWRLTNYRRLVREIQLSAKPLCAAGYNQLHQATYDIMASKPFAWFPGSALAIRKADLHLFDRHKSFGDILDDQQLRGAFLMGARYLGVGTDIRTGRVDRHILIGTTDVELGLLVARGRVHFALINPDQTNYLIRTSKLASNLMVFRAGEMAGPRHVGFICSNATAGEIWQRINDSIAPLGAYQSKN